MTLRSMYTPNFALQHTFEFSKR